mmetsp:Transcript_19864/g.46550  ORF Transcript_19864/g.46550 Transcript_19864/m.46550 type:complete len:245 (+) Transcript_19864:77-811(+)
MLDGCHRGGLLLLLLFEKHVRRHCHHDNQHCQECVDLELLGEGREQHLAEVDHEHGYGLADVLLHRVQNLQQRHREHGLRGKGCHRQHRGVVPSVEEGTGRGDNRRIQKGDHGNRDNTPGGHELAQLRVQWQVLEGLQRLVSLHSGVAGDYNFAQHKERASKSTCGALSTGLGLHKHEEGHPNAHGHEHGPLRCGLLGRFPLDDPHHHRRDDELGLQQHLVGSAIHAGHGHHLKVVAASIEGTD